ncbi:MAG: aromatic ring-hydroxylating dioxygenase subunit alpha [Acidobacteriota bacterium]
MHFEIHPDIRQASTLPGSFYSDHTVHEQLKERLFPRCWHFLGDSDRLRAPGQTQPVTLAEGLLDEPLVLTRDRQDQLHCLSNVCTHRANLVVESEGVARQLRCRYHGRRFQLDGRFLSMPEFQDAVDFPGDCDHLPKLPLESWGKFLFTSLDPGHSFQELIAPVEERVGWLPLAEMKFDAGRSRDYLVQANWALYCDNYLEGFHIPYVHPGLAGVLDYGSYTSELFPWCNLQLGVAADGEDAFDLPSGSPDAGQRIAAYYFWLFPNTMLNVYPWGISVNVVRPLGPHRTRVSFLSYVHDPDRLTHGAGAALDRVEREDEVIVESVQRGTRSRLYQRGRYSPQREQGVHHFHRLLAEGLE